MSRFTWVKDRTAAIDRLLSTNGAHSVPATYRLTNGDRVAANVTFKAAASSASAGSCAAGCRA